MIYTEKKETKKVKMNEFSWKKIEISYSNLEAALVSWMHSMNLFPKDYNIVMTELENEDGLFHNAQSNGNLSFHILVDGRKEKEE